MCTLLFRRRRFFFHQSFSLRIFSPPRTLSTKGLEFVALPSPLSLWASRAPARPQLPPQSRQPPAVLSLFVLYRHCSYSLRYLVRLAFFLISLTFFCLLNRLSLALFIFSLLSCGLFQRTGLSERNAERRVILASCTLAFPPLSFARERQWSLAPPLRPPRRNQSYRSSTVIGRASVWRALSGHYTGYFFRRVGK